MKIENGDRIEIKDRMESENGIKIEDGMENGDGMDIEDRLHIEDGFPSYHQRRPLLQKHIILYHHVFNLTSEVDET